MSNRKVDNSQKMSIGRPIAQLHLKNIARNRM